MLPETSLDWMEWISKATDNKPKPHKCPVCEGEGQRCVPDNPGGTAANFKTILCHGCDGKGWIVV